MTERQESKNNTQQVNDLEIIKQLKKAGIEVPNQENGLPCWVVYLRSKCRTIKESPGGLAVNLQTNTIKELTQHERIQMGISIDLWGYWNKNIILFLYQVQEGENSATKADMVDIDKKIRSPLDANPTRVVARIISSMEQIEATTASSILKRHAREGFGYRIDGDRLSFPSSGRNPI